MSYFYSVYCFRCFYSGLGSVNKEVFYTCLWIVSCHPPYLYDSIPYAKMRVSYFFFFVNTFLHILPPFKLCLYIFVKAQCPFDIYLIIDSAIEIKLITVNCKGLGNQKKKTCCFFEKLKNYYSNVKRKE